ncbi:hypothetical protein FB45DRAFT_101338 [Roridomyces roridus]|uniref:Fork-head domain-containing protein n=1 Tax=Roridomyces roridus TaxID=1738132 RepID=A0AAD7FGP8_9AGAR|nr:hypothetical protein FB45DRAFT_101338 [Roridomyces roridus]
MASPISQLLNSLGITRQDLSERSEQMKRFLSFEPSEGSSRVSNAQPASSTSDSQTLSRSSSSSALITRQPSHPSSITTHDASPTPGASSVKLEPTEEPLPSRPFDAMEAVLERQRLNRKQKRSKRREQDPREQDSPPDSRDVSPEGPRQPLPPLSRDDSRETSLFPRPPATQPPPVTPSRSKHYREHTSYTGAKVPVVKPESPSPTPTCSRAPAPAPSPAPASTSAPAPATTSAPIPATTSAPAYPYPYYYYSAAYSQSRFLSLPFRTAPASTPVKSTRFQQSSPLPPSSPPDATSPASSPVHPRLFNVVSSPGPMMSEGEEAEKALPYTLPPGPYSHERPHYSYAALIGQAILSSPEHRLTLQEIYEWIVTVYPHYKRGERTWMNSIRHVLSTTVHFRKISRERSAGRSHWAIFDDDLECFADKNYRRPGAMVRSLPVPRPKKRPAEEDVASSPSTSTVQPRAKRFKETSTSMASSVPAVASEQPPFLLPALVHPQGKPKNSRTGSHHQSYYESCKPAPLPFVPSDILFPPLPSGSDRLVAISRKEDNAEGNGAPSSPVLSSSAPGPPSTPDLTPNNSSSSPIPESDDAPPSDDRVAVKHESSDDSTLLRPSPILAGDQSLLRPVQFWQNSADKGQALQPGIQLQDSATIESDDDDDDDVPLILLYQADKLEKRRQVAPKKATPSPTLHRRKTATAARTGSKNGKRKKSNTARVVPTIAAPSTPPRNTTRRKTQLSPMHTPLSHKGGSRSYLDPPPVLGHAAGKRRADDEDVPQDDAEPAELMQTPSRKRNVSGPSAYPITPRRLLFPSDGSSPFRTPGGGVLGASPFRTPLGFRGGIFDPHDPSTLLD